MDTGRYNSGLIPASPYVVSGFSPLFCPSRKMKYVLLQQVWTNLGWRIPFPLFCDIRNVRRFKPQLRINVFLHPLVRSLLIILLTKLCNAL